MLQRNTSGYRLMVPELCRELGPGDEVDHDHPICGFTPVKDEPKPAPALKAGEPKPKTAAKANDETKEQGK